MLLLLLSLPLLTLLVLLHRPCARVGWWSLRLELRWLLLPSSGHHGWPALRRRRTIWAWRATWVQWLEVLVLLWWSTLSSWQRVIIPAVMAMAIVVSGVMSPPASSLAISLSLSLLLFLIFIILLEQISSCDDFEATEDDHVADGGWAGLGGCLLCVDTSSVEDE